MLSGEGEMQRRLEYGQRLRALRLALGYDVANDFCREVNRAAGLPAVAHEGLLTAQRLNNYEKGRSVFRFGDEILPILQGLGISMDYLVSGNVALLPQELRAGVLANLKAIQAA